MKKTVLKYNMFRETKKYTDKILDNISKNGIESLSDEEREFLDSHKDGKEEETYNRIKNEFSDKIGDINVKFIYTDSEEEDGFLTHYGTLIIEDGIKHEYDGSITEFQGTFITDFENELENDWMLVEGLEYEYEQFIEYVFGELEDNYNLRL
jgi:hypothetical protein